MPTQTGRPHSAAARWCPSSVSPSGFHPVRWTIAQHLVVRVFVFTYTHLYNQVLYVIHVSSLKVYIYIVVFPARRCPGRRIWTSVAAFLSWWFRHFRTICCTGEVARITFKRFFLL